MRKVRRTPVLHVVVAVLIGMGVGTSVPEIASRMGVVSPRPGWFAAFALAGVAVVLGAIARSAWRDLRERKRLMSSEHAIRLLALAKASVVVGAIFLGGYAGFALMYLDALQTPLGRERVAQSALAALASIGVVVTALWLERALRLPEEDDETPSGAAPTS